MGQWERGDVCGGNEKKVSGHECETGREFGGGGMDETGIKKKKENNNFGPPQRERLK